jgi:four helix bundle protein
MPVFEIADFMENRKKFRFSEQLRAAMLSVSNNMAEGSGSASDADFAHFLNIARRSIFEVANMLIVLHRNGILAERPSAILSELVELSKMTFAYRKRLLQSNLFSFSLLVSPSLLLPCAGSPALPWRSAAVRIFSPVTAACYAVASRRWGSKAGR